MEICLAYVGNQDKYLSDLKDDYFNTDCEKSSTLFHMNVHAQMVLYS